MPSANATRVVQSWFRLELISIGAGVRTPTAVRRYLFARIDNMLTWLCTGKLKIRVSARIENCVWATVMYGSVCPGHHKNVLVMDHSTINWPSYAWFGQKKKVFHAWCESRMQKNEQSDFLLHLLWGWKHASKIGLIRRFPDIFLFSVDLLYVVTIEILSFLSREVPRKAMITRWPRR